MQNNRESLWLYDRIQWIDMESWTEELEDKIIELWQQNECLYDIICKAYSDRVKNWSAIEKIAKKIIDIDVTRSYVTIWLYKQIKYILSDVAKWDMGACAPS